MWKTICKWFWGGLFLFKLGWAVQFNLKSPYMKFRFETAFGDPEPKITWTMIKQMINYGYWYWAHNMNKETKL